MKIEAVFECASFTSDPAGRTLTGVLLPFGVISAPSLNPATGKPALWTFDEGTVAVPEEPSDAVLNYGHDTQSLYMQLGAAASLDVVPGVGVTATWNVAGTPEGDRVLALAQAKALKSFSAEVSGEFTTEKSDNPDLPLMRAKAVTVTGGAVVRKPAFTGAAITSVAASAAQIKENTMKCDKCGVVHAASITECDATQVAAFQAAQAATSPVTKADVDKVMADVQAMSAKLAALEDIKIPVGPGSATLQVVEEPIYRFAGSIPAPSGFDFATDLLAASKDGDGAALERLKKYTADHLGPNFADQPTTSGDVAAINPSTYRPDMFLGQAPVPASPLYDFFYKGSLGNITPFFYSKLDRTNTDVGVADHVEDTNPESRDLVTAAGATVTPVPVSGRVHITREVADQGGSPQVSGLIRYEFDRSFKLACETKTAALLLASAATELGAAITAGETSGAVAGAIVEAGLVGLQFLDDGFRFEKGFGHIDLYTLLAKAEEVAVSMTSADVLVKTGTGKKIYPIINPQNATGQAASKWSYMDIGGYRFSPAARLGATDTNKKSYVADPLAVHVWNSGLQNLDKLNENAAGWDIAVFAYWAGIVYDVTGLRKITCDPTA